MTDVANLKINWNIDVKSTCRSWCEAVVIAEPEKGDRVALIAETSSGFVEAFFPASMPA